MVKKSVIEIIKAIPGEVTLGKLLRAIRLEEGVSTEKFAIKLGTTRTRLGRVERGTRSVPDNILIEWADKLGYSSKPFLKLAKNQLPYINKPDSVPTEHGMRICSKCKIIKADNEIEFPSVGKICRMCWRTYNQKRKRPPVTIEQKKLRAQIKRRRRTRTHELVDQKKAKPCVDCCKSFPPYVMDFDHRDPSTKEFEICQGANKNAVSQERLLLEIDKCDVVCANCHRLRSWKAPKLLDYRRELKIRLKNKPCADCGGHFHYSQMDFDHVKGEKVKTVSQCKNIKDILKEAAKCDVICANCHRKRTQAQDKGQKRLITPQLEKKSEPWWSLVGTMPDAKLARQFKVSSFRVFYYRNKVGIPVYRPLQCVPSPTFVEPGHRKRGGIKGQSKASPGGLPALRPWHNLVGTMLDTEIAEQYNLASSTVTQYRVKVGIPRFKPKIFRMWHALAGTILDKEVARQFGISGASVAHYRKLMGIPKFCS